MIDLRFAKGGLETRITDKIRLDIYADSAFTFGYLNSNINGDYISQGVHTGERSPAFTSGYSPAIIPEYAAELIYNLGEDNIHHVMIGARYREYDLRILRGSWYEQASGDDRDFKAYSKEVIANIFENSVYLGYGFGGIIKDIGNEEKKADGLFQLTLRVGVTFNNIRNRWKNSLEIDSDNPAVFVGIDIGIRY